MTDLLFKEWEIVDMVADFLEDRSGPLGLAFVGKYGEERIPTYPAVVIVPGPKSKELHATQTFQVLVQLHLYVYHADLTLTKRERSKQDLVLVANIEAELERDYGWQTDPDDTDTKRIVFGYVSDTEPGAVQPRTNKSNMVISTRMTWRAMTQRRFDNAG